jgi:hypothetical protein
VQRHQLSQGLNNNKLPPVASVSTEFPEEHKAVEGERSSIDATRWGVRLRFALNAPHKPRRRASLRRTPQRHHQIKKRDTSDELRQGTFPKSYDNQQAPSLTIVITFTTIPTPTSLRSDGRSRSLRNADHDQFGMVITIIGIRMLEDDKLISEVRVIADQLLLLPHEREAKANDAFVVIHVKLNYKTPRTFDQFF